MQVIERLAPGFDKALESFPGARDNLQRRQAALEEGLVSERSLALIGVAVAHRLGGSYACWVMERSAQRVGVSAEDIFFASCGTAYKSREGKIVRAAWNWKPTLLSGISPLSTHIEYAALACAVLGQLAPSLGATEPSARKG